jgi:tetratricopeptide (TPR) repeat protein
MAQVAEFDRESPDEAVDHLMAVLDIDNSNEATYQQLERILTALERHHDVVELLQRHAEVHAALGNVPAELSCLARAADIWEGPLESPDAAGEILEKILARDPNSVAALTRLAKIYEGSGEWDRCGEILQKALALGPQGREAADLYVRMAEVALNRSGDEAAAQQHYAQALQFDGYHPAAVAAVEQAAREREDWATVADMVRRRYESTQDLKERTDLAVELADLYGARLGQAQAVIPLLEQAVQAAPEDPRVLGPLADLYFHAGRHAEAAPMLEKLAEEAKKKRKMKDVARYKQRLAGIFQATGDSTAALAAYEEAFRIDPTNVATMAGLGQLHMAAQDWEKARRVYRSMVLQNLDPSLGISKADVYYQLGQIHLQLGEAPKAKGMFQRGLDTDPDHEALKQALASLG